jgi:hypothetical protein
MASVPDNQEIEKVLKTCCNIEFVAIAESYLPSLYTWPRIPRGLVRFECADSEFFGVRAVESQAVINERLIVCLDDRTPNREQSSQETWRGDKAIAPLEMTVDG